MGSGTRSCDGGWTAHGQGGERQRFPNHIALREPKDVLRRCAGPAFQRHEGRGKRGRRQRGRCHPRIPRPQGFQRKDMRRFLDTAPDSHREQTGRPGQHRQYGPSVKQAQPRIRQRSFIEKRRWIIDADRDTTFVPPCTKNVFLKYYTDNPNDFTFWSHEDREGYLDGPHGIIATLKSYLEEEETK